MKIVLEARQHALTRPVRYPEFEHDVNRLVPADFLDRTPYEFIGHLPRYLKAVEVRP